MLQIPKHPKLKEELVHREHQELRLLSRIPTTARSGAWCTNAWLHLPEQHLKWAPFSGTQLCLAADAFSSSCTFFQRTILITLSSPILKEIRAHKSGIKEFLVLWNTIYSSHAVAAEAQGSSSLAPIIHGFVDLCLLQHQSFFPLQEAAVLCSGHWYSTVTVKDRKQELGQ